MNEKTCFFIGSRNTADCIKEPLTEAIEQHINEYGVTTFTVGHYGSFDRLVTGVLIEAKKLHPHIKLYLLLPYHPFDQSVETPEDFNGTIYPEGMEKVPKPYAIVQANRYMIQHSDYLIAHAPGVGNSRNFVEYAKKREKKGLIKITLLYEPL